MLVAEKDQSEKTIYRMIPPIWHSGTGKTVETVKGSLVIRAKGEGKMNRWSTEEF